MQNYPWYPYAWDKLNTVDYGVPGYTPGDNAAGYDYDMVYKYSTHMWWYGTTTGDAGNWTKSPPTTVPEPSTMLLLGLGLMGLTGIRRKK